MPFLLMLQEANASVAGASGDPDPARPTTTGGGGPLEMKKAPFGRSGGTGRSAILGETPDAVQMTPELWQRGNYLHRLNNEFSLDLSQPMALRVLDNDGLDSSGIVWDDPQEDHVEAEFVFDDVPLDFADETHGLAGTDQLPFLATKLLGHARASLASQASAYSENGSAIESAQEERLEDRSQDGLNAGLRFASLEDDDVDAATPPHGDGEIILDSFALEALAVGTMPTGLKPIGSYRLARAAADVAGGHDDDNQPFASLSDDDDGNVTPPSIEHAAADVALRVLEGEGNADLDAEFDRLMRDHYDAESGKKFGRDLEHAFSNAMRGRKSSPSSRAPLQGAPPSSASPTRAPVKAAQTKPRKIARPTPTEAAQRLAHDVSMAELDEVALSAIASIANEFHHPVFDDTDPSLLFDENSPFVDEDWQFAETQNAGSRSAHDLSTEISLHQTPNAPRRAVRSRRRPRRERGVAKRNAQTVDRLSIGEVTNPKRTRLPWESLGSSALLDSGWEAPEPPIRSPRVEAIDAFDDETIPISHPDQRAAHRRARELFLGAVTHYRAGRLPAAHADALLACVFDPENPTYKTMTARWAEELMEHHAH